MRLLRRHGRFGGWFEVIAMRDDEHTPLVVGGDAPVRRKAGGGLTLGKTAWSFCMVLILVSLSVLGAVLTVGSLRGGFTRGTHRAEHFKRDSLNETIAEVDYDYASGAAHLDEPALGDSQPRPLPRWSVSREERESETDARAEMLRERRVERRTSRRVANRQKAGKAATEAEAEEAATEAEGLSEAESAEQQRRAARARRVAERQKARAVNAEEVRAEEIHTEEIHTEDVSAEKVHADEVRPEEVRAEETPQQRIFDREKRDRAYSEAISSAAATVNAEVEASSKKNAPEVATPVQKVNAPPPSPPSPPPPPPPRPPFGQPPAAFHSLMPLPGLVAGGSVAGTAESGGDARAAGGSAALEASSSDAAGLGVAEHLGVVSAFWEAPLKDGGRWRSALRRKTPEYYRRGLDNLVRAAARSGNSVVVFTSETSDECRSLEKSYGVGALSFEDVSSRRAAAELPLAPRFLCARLPLRNLRYVDWHLADHSLVKDMPCSEKMRDTKLVWLNKINLVESAAHALSLPGGARATRMEWIDADQYAEREDVRENTGGAFGRGVRLEDLSQWRALPREGRAANHRGLVSDSVFSRAARKGFPEDRLETRLTRAEATAAAADFGTGGSSSRPGAAAADRGLPPSDRVQMGCYAPKQRVGPCTSNFFVASRFRASARGIATMRQAFEDVLYDYEREFPGPGFDGWSVQNLTWWRWFREEHDRPGYATSAFMYAKDGFTTGKDGWCCVCSTEEMIYNKMYRRNPELFLPDAHCDASPPYETLERGADSNRRRETAGGAGKP